MKKLNIRYIQIKKYLSKNYKKNILPKIAIYYNYYRTAYKVTFKDHLKKLSYF